MPVRSGGGFRPTHPALANDRPLSSAEPPEVANNRYGVPRNRPEVAGTPPRCRQHESRSTVPKRANSHRSCSVQGSHFAAFTASPPVAMRLHCRAGMTQTFGYFRLNALVLLLGVAACNSADDASNANPARVAPPLGTCTSAPGDHAAACPADACPITEDVVLQCSDTLFATHALSVAPSSETTYVSVTNSSSLYDQAATRLFTVSAAAGKPIDNFPLHVRKGPLALAVAADGTLYTAGDETFEKHNDDPSGPSWILSGGFAVATQKGGVFTRSDVFVNMDDWTPFVDMDVAPDGKPSLWLELKNSNGVRPPARATLGAGGKWSVEKVAWPGMPPSAHFGLATDGAPLGFGILTTGDNAQILVHAGAQDIALGPAQSSYSRILPIQVPTHPAAGIAPYAAVIQDNDGLRVAWPTGSTYAETKLEGTAEIALKCPVNASVSFPLSESCPMVCEETSVGLEGNAFAAARTDSGDVWVAYAISHYDETWTYAPGCSPGQQDGSCVCNITAKRRGTSSELFVVRLSLDGQPPALVAKLPMGPLAQLYSKDDGRPLNPGTLIAARAFGEDVAIAVRVVAEGGNQVRVLRIHDSKG